MGKDCCSSSSKGCDGGGGDGGERANVVDCNNDTAAAAATALCLAVVREDGANVVVFDAAGKPRTFHYSSGDIRKLCFQTHGSSDADDLLTPCFDEDGNHGSPEEDCFCGVDTPHLHAHLYDPQTCQEKCGTASAKKEMGFLASQVLHPNTDEVEEEHAALLTIGVSEGMPKECNSAGISKPASTNSTNNSISSSRGDHDEELQRHWRRVHPVQHDDHLDYLVHNTKTGHLHLQHPCNDCGLEDVHGTFRAVGQRRWRRPGKQADMQVHFFHVPTRPFSVLEYIHTAFETQSDRVAVASQPLAGRERRSSHSSHSSRDLKNEANNTSNNNNKVIVSSTFFCNGVCCAAECPVVHEILNPLPGVDKVMINVPLKQVIVKHNPHTITAAQVKAALDQGRMNAQIKHDGAEGLVPSKATTTTGRSRFHVQEICCASEIPAITRIVEPLTGVKSLSINATTKKVYVDHDFSVISAADICLALNRERFGAEIQVDAATTTTQNASRAIFVGSKLTLTNTTTTQEPDTDQLTSFLKGFDSSQMENFVVNVPAKTIDVVHNPFLVTADKIAQLLREETSLEATVTVDGADPNLWTFLHQAMAAKEEVILENGDGNSAYPKPTVILSGVFWIVSMLHLVGGNWEYLKYVGLLSVFFGLPPIAMKAFRTLQRLQFDTNCLMFFASVGAVALQEFAEAAAVVFLFAISEWLEVRATSRARQALSAIVQLRPDTANLVHPTTQELFVIPASVVPVGALVSVKTGDKIPCDGIVNEGRSTVDESSLTGESRPITKGPDSKVSGGTVNSGLSQLMVRTTATCDNSAVSRLIRLVEEAQANRSETEKLVDEFARWYTPVIVLAALFMCTIPWAFGSDTGKEWTANGLILIVVACPCALIISTPVSYVAGLAATAQRGILIKGGATLEALGTVKNICVDKTGTLTNGEFAVLHLETLSDNLSRKEVIQYLALMEERASHPVAQAILNAAKNENVTLPKDMVLEKHMIIAGEGVEGVVNGLAVHVGNERLFERLGLLTGLDSAILAEVESWKALGGTVGFMGIEGHGIVCAYCAADGVREESARVVGRLQKQGVRVTMLTGDNHDAAQAIGRQVGLNPDQIQSKLLPEEKLRFIEDLSSAGEAKSTLFNVCGSKEITLMCGDGVNDAPALAAANIGVAMGAGAALAMETSDVTLLDSNLEKLEYSIEMGKKVIRKIQENVIFSVAVKFIVLGFALAGMTHLWAAIASDVGAMILVTLNSMMLLPRKQKRADVLSLKGDIEEGKDGRLGLARQNSSTTLDADGGMETSIRKNDKANSSQPKAAASSCKKSCCPPKGTEATSNCKKGCCEGKKDTGNSCKKGCCPLNETEASSSCTKGCCEGKKDTGNSCSKKGCCEGKKETSNSCKKGCCPPNETEATSSCKKGCCEGKKDTFNSCKKGCCERKKETNSSCKKGCCPPKETKATSDCKKGCCESKKETSSSCKKGCCAPKETEATGDCQKGCCDGK